MKTILIPVENFAESSAFIKRWFDGFGFTEKYKTTYVYNKETGEVEAQFIKLPNDFIYLTVFGKFNALFYVDWLHGHIFEESDEAIRESGAVVKDVYFIGREKCSILEKEEIPVGFAKVNGLTTLVMFDFIEN